MEWPKITKDTPMSNMQIIHKQIWDYVIEHDEKPTTPYVNDCAICQYVQCRSEDGTVMCQNCPSIWPGEHCALSNVSLVKIWFLMKYNGDLDGAKEIAEQIRDIPFKEDLQ